MFFVHVQRSRISFIHFSGEIKPKKNFSFSSSHALSTHWRNIILKANEHKKHKKSKKKFKFIVIAWFHSNYSVLFMFHFISLFCSSHFFLSKRNFHTAIDLIEIDLLYALILYSHSFSLSIDIFDLSITWACEARVCKFWNDYDDGDDDDEVVVEWCHFMKLIFCHPPSHIETFTQNKLIIRSKIKLPK
jgi:hypothetical protein